MADNYYGITDTGKVRSNNEDCFIADPLADGKYVLGAVIDGVGGYEGGEVASQIARDTIAAHLKHFDGDIIEALKEAVLKANDEIYKEKQKSAKNDNMACVLTLALTDIEHNRFYYAHVGDTRLYLYRDESLVKITKDHSFVGYLEDEGKLSEEDAMRHPKRNEINKALGFESSAHATTDYVEVGQSPFLPQDILLLCSDGLTDMVNNQVMRTILRTSDSLKSKGKALVHAANEAGGKDNVTAVLLFNDKEPTKHEAKKPVAQEKVSPAVAGETRHKEEVAVKKKRRNPIRIFVVLFILILAALGWVVYQNFINSKQINVEEVGTERKRTAEELLLIDSINGTKTNEVFILNQEGSAPIVITDSILVYKDTLHIIGNGATLLSDSSYHGAAFVLSSACKYVLFDSLTFDGFNTAVVTQSPVLHFRKVQFKNCKVPVQYNFVFPDSPLINGRLADTVFYNSDVKPTP